jgi:hypothetical protein
MHLLERHGALREHYDAVGQLGQSHGRRPVPGAILDTSRTGSRSGAPFRMPMYAPEGRRSTATPARPAGQRRQLPIPWSSKKLMVKAVTFPSS